MPGAVAPDPGTLRHVRSRRSRTRSRSSLRRRPLSNQARSSSFEGATRGTSVGLPARSKATIVR